MKRDIKLLLISIIVGGSITIGIFAFDNLNNQDSQNNTNQGSGVQIIIQNSTTGSIIIENTDSENKISDNFQFPLDESLTEPEPTKSEGDKNKFATKILYEDELPLDSENIQISVKIQEGWAPIHQFQSISCGQKGGFERDVPIGVSEYMMSDVITHLGEIMPSPMFNGVMIPSNFDQIADKVSKMTNQTLSWEKKSFTSPNMELPDLVSDWAVYQKYQDTIFTINQTYLEGNEISRTVSVHDLLPFFDQDQNVASPDCIQKIIKN